MQRLFELAADQHGLLTRKQLRDHGVDRHRVGRWLKTGRLVQVQPRVLALAGSANSPRREILAKVLETGLDACASHTTAAWLWGISGYGPHPVHVVVTRQSRHHERLNWTVHQFTGLPPHHRRTVDGVLVTSPALTMLHLAQIVSRKRLERAIDNAWNLRLLTGRDLLQLDFELSIKGRNGIRALRNASAARGDDWVPPQSNIESRFMELMNSVGHGGFRRQVEVAGEQWSARVDFLHERSATVVEIQSERYHTSLSDREADNERRVRLEAAGFTVVEVWDNEIFQQPAVVLDRVAQAIHRAA
jgi:very-short-patch-repair endonuclease